MARAASVVRSRRAAVLLAVLGAAAALLGQSRSWAGGTVRLASGAALQVQLGGGSAAPGVGALALVALAGAVVLATAGVGVRRVAAGLLLATGIGLVWLVGAVRGSAATLHSAVAAATGTTGDPSVLAASAVTWSAWPAVVQLGGGCVAVAGALALLGSSTWSGPSARFERPLPAGSGPGPLDRPATRVTPLPDPWDALNRGEDPTAGQDHAAPVAGPADSHVSGLPECPPTRKENHG